VVLSHVGYDVPLELPRHGAWIVLRAFLNNLVNGPAAVIAFFVISGFCIHYPNRRTERVRVLPFYVRRELRILPPVAVVLALGPFVGCQFDSLNDATLWSLVCEEIYYFLYPLLLVAFQRVGVRWMIAGSFVVAYAVVWALAKPHDGYRDLGWRYTWIIGLPCWLLGCELAEQLDTRSRQALSPTPGSIWTLRGAVLVASMLAQGLHFHSPLTLPWTLDLFAILCFFWLRAEVAGYMHGDRRPWFEAGGAASYSIYLVHPVTLTAWRTFHGPDSLLLRIAFAFAASFALYWAVERPSHRLARWAYGRMSADSLAA
jgi:peptidoglycan/LPS O-acetylase OafA/YrhL